MHCKDTVTLIHGVETLIREVARMTDAAGTSDLPSFPFPSHSLTPPAEYAERRATCPFGQVRLPSGDPASCC